MPRSGARIPSNAGLPRLVRRARGFTLLELMLAAAVGALLLALAVPGYQRIIERQRVSRCVGELMMIAMRIEKYRAVHASLPTTLAQLGEGVPAVDPWGFNYRYLNFAASGPAATGLIRKDHNLHPLNSEFDLYSVGPDGRTFPPLTAPVSHDDVVWARDGGFVGVARDY